MFPSPIITPYVKIVKPRLASTVHLVKRVPSVKRVLPKMSAPLCPITGITMTGETNRAIPFMIPKTVFTTPNSLKRMIVKKDIGLFQE